MQVNTQPISMDAAAGPVPLGKTHDDDEEPSSSASSATRFSLLSHSPKSRTSTFLPLRMSARLGRIIDTRLFLPRDFGAPPRHRRLWLSLSVIIQLNSRYVRPRPT